MQNSNVLYTVIVDTVPTSRGYHEYLKRLFLSTLELVERYNSTRPVEDYPDTLAELLSQ